MPRPRFFLIAFYLFAITPSIAFATMGQSVGQANSTNVILLIFYVVLSLVVSFICSISEATLLTMTPSYIDTLNEDSPKTADLLNEVKVANIEKSISSILTLNTIANTLGSLGAGSQATIVFGSAWLGCLAV